MTKFDIQPITRLESGPRLSRVVVHGSRVYLSGLTADDCSYDVVDQTRQIIRKIDEKLRLAGTDESNLLAAQIWLKDAAGIQTMACLRQTWLAPGEGPACTFVVCYMADNDVLVEVTVTAAMP